MRQDLDITSDCQSVAGLPTVHANGLKSTAPNAHQGQRLVLAQLRQGLGGDQVARGFTRDQTNPIHGASRLSNDAATRCSQEGLEGAQGQDHRGLTSSLSRLKIRLELGQGLCQGVACLVDRLVGSAKGQ
ncbi:MAG: hypothetical protein RL043_476 [Pseudomonadota bacterium]